MTPGSNVQYQIALFREQPCFSVVGVHAVSIEVPVDQQHTAGAPSFVSVCVVQRLYFLEHRLLLRFFFCHGAGHFWKKNAALGIIAPLVAQLWLLGPPVDAQAYRYG